MSEKTKTTDNQWLMVNFVGVAGFEPLSYLTFTFLILL